MFKYSIYCLILCSALSKMEVQENKPKLLSCMVKGPGPAYTLPTLVGYEGHDPSRHRNPSYTIRGRTRIHVEVIGPGPRYNISKLTKHGPDNPPAHTIAGREHVKLRDLGPGPGAHYPELCPPVNHSVRPPAFSIKARDVTKISDRGPGPNAYILPSCIGPKIPDKTAQGAFTIAGYHEVVRQDFGPGPAGYSRLNQDLIKPRSPAFSLKWRNKIMEIDFSPGPKYNPDNNTRKRSPMYSFGVKHSECAGTPITSLDED